MCEGDIMSDDPEPTVKGNPMLGMAMQGFHFPMPGKSVKPKVGKSGKQGGRTRGATRGKRSDW